MAYDDPDDGPLLVPPTLLTTLIYSRFFFFEKRKVGRHRNQWTVALGKDAAGTRSEHSERQGRRAQPEASRGRRGREKMETGGEERRREGEGLRAAHLARTQLVAKRSEFCDCGSV